MCRMPKRPRCDRAQSRLPRREGPVAFCLAMSVMRCMRGGRFDEVARTMGANNTRGKIDMQDRSSCCERFYLGWVS